MLTAPGGFVAVDVAADLRGPGAERPHERRQLADLAGLRVQGEPVGREDRPESGVGDHGGVPDPVDRLDRVPDPDRVDPPPRPGRPDPGVDLKVQVAVRVAGAGGVVPDHGSLDALDRDLHLPTPRPDPGGRVPGDPADDLAGSLVLGCVQRGRDVWMKGCGQGPGLRSVDGDLNEPQRVRVVTHPALLPAGVDVDAGDPLLVGLAVHRPRVLDAVRGSRESLRDSGPLTEVVVIGPRAIALHVGAGGLRCTVVELHPAVHADHPESWSQRRPSTTNEPRRNAAWAARSRATHLRPS
jgi:hypothetical protein